MLNSISKWLPNKTPHLASHGQRTPTNTTTTTPSQTRTQPTPTQGIHQPTTTSQNQNHLTTTKQSIQLRSPNLPRRGRPILVKRQQQSQSLQQSQQSQRHISLKNYEILSQESYAQLLNQSQVVTSQNNQVQNPIQILNQQPILLNANQTTLQNPTTPNQSQLIYTTTQPNPSRARTEFLSQSHHQRAKNQTQLLNSTTTQPNLNRARTEFLSQTQQRAKNQTQLLNSTTTQPNLNRARTEFLSQTQQRARIQTQLLNSTTIQPNLNRARTEFLMKSHQRAREKLEANQLRELQILQQKTKEQILNQETNILETQSPIYKIISVPFLTRTYLPAPSVKQRESKTNGLVKLKQIIVNRNGKNGQRIILCPEQENISAHLNLLNQQLKQQPESSNILNTSTTTEKNLSTNTNLNLTKNLTPTTITETPSTTMMGIQLSGNEFQDLNGALQIAAVEELMAPASLDDYFIETNNNIDFDITKGTYKLQELNEMTINQMNVNYAGQHLQLLPEDGQEQLLKDIPGEENIYNILRLPHSEELVTLTQPSIGHETQLLESESLFTQYIDTNRMFAPKPEEYSDNNSSSSYIDISPGSPLPTESDCIATSELHNYKYNDDNCNSIAMRDDEQSYRFEFSPSQSIEPPLSEPQHSPSVCQSNSSADEDALDLEQILKQLEAASQQQNNTANLKRSSDHFGATQTKVAKKSRMNLPMTRLVTTNAMCEDILNNKVPDTPEVCDMVDEWLTEDIDASIHSLSSSPSWSDTPFVPLDAFTLIEPKYENPPSIASSYVCEEPSYATPSPSNSSSCTLYSTNPNSPAVSQYGSNSGSSSRKPRGRPPKQHSDLPNPEILRNLPETERKRIEDRCKNNEASRQSRQKNKEKQMILIAEEEREQHKNQELKSRMRMLEKQHLKLKKVLYRKLGNSI